MPDRTDTTDGSNAETARAQSIALRLLRVTDRSRAALIERLIERDIAPVVAEATADRLERANLLSDRRLADELIARTLARTPTGRDRLAAQLEAAGVPADIAEAALEEHFAGRDPLADAEALARMKLRALPKTVAADTAARRIAGALARRGFDEDTVAEAVGRVVPPVDPIE